MFIEEQKFNTPRDYAPAFQHDPETTERWVWSPVSCRHTFWTYAPLVRGYCHPGARYPVQRRNPFIDP